MFLPEHNQLDIGKLSSVFRDTTNSYKFYWFLSILDSLRDNGESIISQKDIALRMLANVWYPLDYFKLSFGKQDSFKNIAQFISSKMTIDNSPNSQGLFEQINYKFSEKELEKLSRQIKDLYRYVPYLFIRPFFGEEIRANSHQSVKKQMILFCNQYFENQPHRVIYRIVGDSIELNSIWVEYLQKHQGILRGFIFWHLIKFVQKNNPNVIGLSEKLQKPVQRDLGLANKFWRSYLNSNPNCTCIYSGQVITSENLSLDHFLPWSYVAHDQLWNIIPTTRKVNSTKSNSLPSLELYFEAFARLQFEIVEFYLGKSDSKILEDYSQVFKVDLSSLSSSRFKEKLEQIIFPQFQIAQNTGFSSIYVYKK